MSDGRDPGSWVAQVIMDNILQRYWRIVLIVILVLLTPLAWKFVSIERIREFLFQFGSWKAGIFYVLLYTFSIRPFIPIPPTAYTVFSGILFGSVLGGLLTIAGATANAMLTYWIARGLGYRWIATKERVESVLEKVRGSSFKMIFFIRLSPIGPPFDLVSYAAGLAGIGFAGFSLGTAVGVIPGTFLFTFLGSRVAEEDLMKMLLPVFLASLAFVLFPWYLKKRSKA